MVEIGFLERLYYYSQIIGTGILIITLVAAIVSSIIAFKEYRHNKRRCQLEKAIDIAKEYKTLIENSTIVMNIIQQESNVLKIINKIKLDQLNDFDSEECSKIFTQEDRIILNDFFIKKKASMEPIIQMHALMNPVTLDHIVSNEGKLMDLEAKALKSAFYSRIVSLLNELEHISMALISNIAEKDILFQSLHQSFFGFIVSFYYYICTQNTDPSDKYYTNLIELFRIWRDRDKENKEKIEQAELDEARYQEYLHSQRKNKEEETIKPPQPLH